MTWQHFLRTLTVAGLVTFALAAGSQARAESGEREGVYASAPSAPEPSAGTDAPQAPPEEVAVPVLKASRSGKVSERVAADSRRAGSLKPLIVRYAAQNDLPVALADAVIRLESRYNPAARN